MADFLVKVKAGNGKLVEHTIIADDKEHALRLAGKEGRIVSIKRVSHLSSLLSRGMNDAERIIFLRRLSTMVRSRMGMGDSLRIMRSAFKGSVARASDELLRRVEAGADFGDAMMEMRRDFPQTTAALIRAGIRGGSIHTALEDAAAFEVEMSRIRRESSRGIMSAVSSFLLSAAVVIGSSFFLGPYVMESDLIKAAGSSVDIAWVFTSADIIAYMMLVITLVFLALLTLSYAVKPMAPAFADRLILKIPIYRDLVLSQSHYTVFYGMGLLVKSGVRMEDALRLSYEAAPPGEVAEDIRRALNAVKRGQPWPQAMKHLHPTDRAALSTSQDREQVGQSLDAVALQYRDSYAERVQQVVPALQLTAALFMSLGGAIIFGMVILPTLQMTQGIL